jgi:DNA topoisomerase I
VRAIARVADELGNTPAVARKGYIHPAVIAAFLAGSLKPIRTRRDRDPYELTVEERSLLKLLSTQQQVNGNGRGHYQRHRGYRHDRGKG